MLAMLLVLAATGAGQDTLVTGVKIKPARKVCKDIDSTGSRMGGYRECHTAAEWRALAAPPLDAQSINNSMNTGGVNAGPEVHGLSMGGSPG